MGDDIFSDDIFNFLDGQPEWVPEPWMLTKSFVLVTEANLADCIDSCINAPKGVYGLDLECTGLDNRVFNGETVSKIVGICLSGDGETGWYIPLRHGGGGAEYNIPWMTFDREFRRLMAATVEGKVRAVFHNGKFDQEFLEFNGAKPYGDWDGHSQWEDTLILAYLRNSRARRKGLKALAEAPHECLNEALSPVGGPGLGMKMLELDDVFKLVFGEDKAKGMEKDFSILDPSNPIVLAYACSDAICTYLLYFLLYPAVVGQRAKPDQKQVYMIEKSAVGGTRWMERNRIPVSKAKVLELIALGQQEWFDSVMEVYEAVAEVLGRDVMPGYFKVLRDNFVHDDPLNLLSHQLDRAKSLEDRLYPNPLGKQRGLGADGKEKDFPLIYDVTAPQQLGVLFDEMQVPGLKRTENSGQVKTSKDELQRVVDEASERFPFMGKIQRFREVNKALATYLYPILLGMDPTDSTIRINFNGHRVDTGRFCTPAKDKDGLDSASKGEMMVGWPALNFQAMPSTYDPRRPESMNRIRECVVARPGFFIVAVDFAGEELRLITNLYREPKWENEFFRCSGCGRTFPKGDGMSTPPPPPPRCPNCGSDKIGDLHTLTALELYGQDAMSRPEWRQLRGNGKGTNFGLSYGGGGQAVCRATGCDKQEGWRIKHQFDATYAGLAAGWARQHDYARKHGYVLTAWGRKYPLPDIKHEDGGFRSKAERNAVNGPIQGSGADIIKIAMALVYKEMKKRGWLDLVKMIASMHDELVFEIHGSVLEDAIEVIKQTMSSNGMIMRQRWPVPFTSDVELGPDFTVKWDLNEMLYGEVRFHGNKKLKKPEQAEALGLVWDDLPSWPEVLIPHFKAAQGGPKTPPPEGGGGGSGETVEAEDEAPPSSQEVSTENPYKDTSMGRQMVPRLKQGDDYEFLVPGLTPMTAVRLAEVIEKCRGNGTHRLRLKDSSGKVLEGWDQSETILVDGTEFYYAARSAGLA